MADTYGLTDTGLKIKSLAVIKDEIEGSLKTTYTSNINLDDRSRNGQYVNISAEREALIWELAEYVYNSQFPDTATGIPLDKVCAITGVIRLAAKKSVQRDQLFFGNVGAVIPAGTKVKSSVDDLIVFETTDTITLITGVDAVQSVVLSNTPTLGNYTLKHNDNETSIITPANTISEIEDLLNALDDLDEVTISGTPESYVVTFAGTDGKQIQPLLTVGTNTLTDAGSASVSITITEITAGIAQGQSDATATSTGPTIALARTLDTLVNSITGVDRTLNPYSDAELGRNIETDAALKIRRTDSLQDSGNAALDAIRAKILALDGVETCSANENYTLLVDANGLPPKSFEMIVRGGLDADIAEAIWKAKAAGIEPFGNTYYSVIDSEGVTRNIGYSRSSGVDIYLELTLTVDSNYPTDGDTLVETAILSYGNALLDGSDVIVYPTLISQLASVNGITDVIIKIGKNPSPTTDDNIIIGAKEHASFSSTRISISHV